MKKAKEVTEVDRLSMLPDDIIAVILSRLTIAEAARSSVLSVQWRRLWTYYSGSLDFDGSFIIYKLERNPHLGTELIHEEREKFKSWVDQVLNSLQTQTVEALRICFDLGNDSHVDSWVQFAIQKKVKKLELNLIHSFLTKNGYEYCVVPSLLKVSTFPSLQVLRLSYVDVSGEHLEYFLSSCPFLETLSVVSSQSVVSFKVSNNSSPLKLKELEIKRCFSLKTLEISAENLVSFTYFGYDISINYKHIPNLKEVWFGGMCVDFSFRNFFHLSTYDHSSRLEVLKLDTMIPMHHVQLPTNLVLANLHHLELFIVLMRESDFNFCVSLINQCHSLRRITLKIAHLDPMASAKIGMKHPYDCLEEVKLVGFSGCTAEVEFIEYIIENATNLKKLLIDPILPIYLGQTIEHKIRKTEDFPLARARARDMGPNIPPWVEFVIL